MIRLLIAAVWICAVTAGAVFYSYGSAGSSASASAPASHGAREAAKTEIMSVPVVRDGRINGYFLARFTYIVDKTAKSALPIPVDTLLLDQLHTYLFANPQIDFEQTKTVDLDALRNGLKESINARTNSELIADVLVEQVDYLARGDIRNQRADRMARDKPRSTQTETSTSASH
ncbi:hypothetical protein [Limoniibacter endophyticus]|uniref:Uncharacterized protein n=1 Tax=Limoniibacter endophyticus TaxID=1565040 RepID=A0A8J3DGM1_9HYPH|nr:hypothetical protein [Limoniibacter endophyticus]GHC64422.1 hypothetical protein GCM10010136_06360 [Limoniibacter endophyticus]